MYNIELAAEQEFSINAASRSPQQPWSFDPPTHVEVITIVGGNNPANITVATQIKNYILQYGTLYSGYFVKIALVHPEVNGVIVQWLSVNGDIAESTGNGYQLTQANLNVDNILVFEQTNIPTSLSSTLVNFNVYGKNANNSLTLLETVPYDVVLFKLPSGAIRLVPTSFIEFSYTIGSPLPTVTKDLFCSGAFTAVIGKHIAMSGTNITLESDVDGVKTYSGIDSQNITFTLEDSIDFEENIQPYYATQVVFKTETSEPYLRAIRVYIFESDQRLVIPEALDFRAIRNVIEAPSQSFAIRGVGNWTITLPSWLVLLGAASGTNSAIRNVRPMASANFTAGVYNAKIKIVFGGEDFFIDVKHTVVEGLDSGFKANTINFTKDRAAISHIYGLDNQKAVIAIDSKAFKYNDFGFKTFTGTFTKGIFAGETNFWLGDLVNKTMPSLNLADIGLSYFANPTGISPVAGTRMPFKVFKYYNPSLTHFLMKFINRDTNLQVGAGKEFFNVSFIKGRRPRRTAGPAAIVDFKQSPIRVTKKSFTLLPIYKKNQSARIDIYRNGVKYATIYPDRGEDTLFGVQLNFNPFTQGDVIDVRLLGLNISIDPLAAMVQRYIMFPEGKNSYHIVWENEHGVPEVLEFTGDYQFDSDHKGVTSLTFSDFLESTQKIATERILKFTANTGWILKSNQERIDSLVDANRAWIVFTDKTMPFIEIIPQDAKITNTDSTAEQYQYDVEFKINPTHELANPTF